MSAYIACTTAFSSQLLTLSSGHLSDGSAAVHRIATAITQLTLCQVTSEVETATKLLTKACHKLQGIPDAPTEPYIGQLHYF